MRELLGKCHDLRGHVVVTRPLQPLVRGWVGHVHDSHAVERMGRYVVADPIRIQIRSTKHNRASGQGHITNAMLKDDRQQHVQHGAACLAQLVEHQHHRLCSVLANAEPSVGCIRCGHGLTVDDGHTQVAKVEVGYVHIAHLVVRQLTLEVLQDG